MQLKVKSVLMYVVVIVVAIAAFEAIRMMGRSLVAPAPGGARLFGIAVPHEAAGVLMHVLLALVVIILSARALGAVFRRLNQPQVIGEMIAGILLGPSFLGHMAPNVAAYVLPNQVAPYLSIVAQIGVILYMFLVGVELDTNLLRGRSHASVAISHASIVAPFLLGGGLALWLYPQLATHDVPFTVFALFIGVAMSITAFPVLARILTDRRMHQSRMGTIALGCAAVDDVTAWCLFAFVVSVAHAKSGSVMLTLALTATFIAAVLFVIGPLAQRLIRRQEMRGSATTKDGIVVVCAALLLAALATDRIGIHALFGAFLIGTVIPHNSQLARDITQKFEDLVVVLLVPVFFAFTGMRTQIGLVQGWHEWMICVVIIAVAFAGKFGGAFAASRFTGLDWRESTALGILMNTRGLMELIVLNVGLDLHVISPTLFGMLVLMAVVTTLATTPVLHAVTRRNKIEIESTPTPAGTGVPGKFCTSGSETNWHRTAAHVPQRYAAAPGLEVSPRTTLPMREPHSG